MNEITTPYPLNGSVFYLRYPLYELINRANQYIPDPFAKNFNVVSYELVGNEYVSYFDHERPFSPLNTDYIMDTIISGVAIDAKMFYLASMPYTIHTEEWLINYMVYRLFHDVEDIYYGYLEYLDETGEFYFEDDGDSPYYRDQNGNIVEIKDPVISHEEYRYMAYIVYLLVQTIAGYYPNLVQQFYFHRDKDYFIVLEEVEEKINTGRHPKIRKALEWMRGVNRMSLLRLEVRCHTY